MLPVPSSPAGTGEGGDLLIASVTLPGSATPSETVRSTVEEVLSRPAFGESQPSLVDQGLQWLSDQLGRVLGLVAGSATGQVLFTIVLACLAVGLLVAAGLFARRLRREGAVDRAAVVAAGGLSAEEWQARAARAEDTGDLREALRCRYRALVAELADRGTVDEAPGRTAGQYLEFVRRAVPAAAGPFDAATTAFERAWYGHAHVSADDVRAMNEAAEATLGRVAEHAGRRQAAQASG